MRIIDRIISAFCVPTNERIIGRENLNEFKKLERQHISRISDVLYNAKYGTLGEIKAETDGGMTYFKVTITWDFTREIRDRINNNLPDRTFGERFEEIMMESTENQPTH